MAEITLPRWILTNMCMPGGRRTAPKPVLVVNGREEYKRDRHSASGSKYMPKEEKGVFEGWEYRFWAAVSVSTRSSASFLTECRGCGNVGGNTIEVRRLHWQHGGCAKKLCAAYKLLLKDKLCVICDCKTSRERWGVPLCGSACEQAWCETESQPKALLAALLLVGDNY